jgi:tetratricopeptide (TPR) repeat protein
MEPRDLEPARVAFLAPLADLILDVTGAKLVGQGDTRTVSASVRLHFQPLGDTQEFEFVSPFSARELDDVAWYLETYPIWPYGRLRERAAVVETSLGRWGRALFEQVAGAATAHVVGAWQSAPGERRFTVKVNRESLSPSLAAEGQLAASALLSLPWELLRDGRGYLFHGARPVRVRRCLANEYPQAEVTSDPPLRVLIVSPRPEQDGIALIDHRISSQAIVEALSNLGSLADFRVLTPATFPALVRELARAAEEKRPYHVVHFDGHGAYDNRSAAGLLYFEHPDDARKPTGRRAEAIEAARLAETIRDQQIALFFLEACESARADRTPIASVAAQLLSQGVTSIVAMSHAVLVETTRRFVDAFYRELLQGRRVGLAMTWAQRALHLDRRRGASPGGELELDDWFVPVLFQDAADPQLVRTMPGGQVRELLAEVRQHSLGELPAVAAAGFKGRSRELLEAERTLEHERYIVLCGSGGEGKTTLAAELARWLVHSRRFAKAAFVSLERAQNPRALMYALGQQLVPDFIQQTGANGEMARGLVNRALDTDCTILVLDNFESVLEPPAPTLTHDFDAATLSEILELCDNWSRRGGTRLIVTSRESLSGQLAGNHLPVGRLDRRAALALAASWLKRDENEEDVAELVELIGCHARSVVLVGSALAELGLQASRENLLTAMTHLARISDHRERSLIASVKLSLDRLPPEQRNLARFLGVFRGGASSDALQLFFGAPKEAVNTFAGALSRVGLAEVVDGVFLHWDPALGAVVDAELPDSDRETAKAAFLSTYWRIAEFLDKDTQENAILSSSLATHESPNLLRALDQLRETGDFANTATMAARLENVLRSTATNRTMNRISSIRAAAACQLQIWDGSRFEIERAAVNELLESDRMADAVAAARHLLNRAQEAGVDAYPEAPRDIAVAQYTIGIALRRAGQLEAAVSTLEEARALFQSLASQGHKRSRYHAYVALGEIATALLALNRLEEAEHAMREALRLARTLGDQRNEAVELQRLARVYRSQGRLLDARDMFQQAHDLFDKLRERSSVGAVLHELGSLYRIERQWKQAEETLLRAYRVRVAETDRYGEALTLAELGSLYYGMHSLEKSVEFYSDAAKMFQDLNAGRIEGIVRTDLANPLIELGRYQEARLELKHALACKQRFDDSVESWRTWALIEKVERSMGNLDAAREAAKHAQPGGVV